MTASQPIPFKKKFKHHTGKEGKNSYFKPLFCRKKIIQKGENAE